MKKYRSIALLVSVLAICLGLIACAAPDKRREVGFNTDVATDVIVANGLDQEITTLGYGNPFSVGNPVQSHVGSITVIADDMLIGSRFPFSIGNLVGSGGDAERLEASVFPIAEERNVDAVADAHVVGIERALDHKVRAILLGKAGGRGGC